MSRSFEKNNIRELVAKRNAEEYVVVKGAVPQTLKLQFKALCIQREVEMSAVLKYLIDKWIKADAPVTEFTVDLSNEETEDVKGYIPKSLKIQFKVLCTQKRVKMRSVLYQLINEWLQQGATINPRGFD